MELERIDFFGADEEAGLGENRLANGKGGGLALLAAGMEEFFAGLVGAVAAREAAGFFSAFLFTFPFSMIPSPFWKTPSISCQWRSGT